MKIFVTSSLPYCNHYPHLGNVCSSTLSGDVYARFKRGQGHEVIYLCGTDEYGSTTTIKAKQENVSCQELCDKYHKLHKKVYDWFNINFDVWGRTSTESQTKITHEIFLELYKNGFIEGKTIVQMYCDNCKMFLADRYIKGTCYHEECLDKKSIANGDQCDFCQKMVDINKLIDPFCYVCKTRPEPRETKHLFLKLDALANEIESYLDDPKRSNFKPNVLSIAKSWLKLGLTSRCITRDLQWGTPVPKGVDDFLDQFSDKVFYVWFDAPFGYYSILAEAKADWKQWLESPDLEWVSTQAKDNIPFHTIVFPASILGSKVKYPLIQQICGTDYLLFEGKKFSKSEGIGLFGDTVINLSNELGINEDYWRFYLIKIRPESQDSSFSMQDFVQTIKTDLVNNIGNFINRCVSLSIKYTDGQSIHLYNDLDISEFVDKYNNLMDNFKFRDALKLCLELSSKGNQYIQVKQPWIVAKTDPASAAAIIGRANTICWILLNLLSPFIPGTGSKLLSSFKCNLLTFRELSTNSNIKIEINNQTYAIPFKNIEEIINLAKP